MFVMYYLNVMLFSTNKTDCHDITKSGIKHHNPNPKAMLYCKL